MTFEQWAEENWMLIDIKSNAKDIWDAAQKEEREECAKMLEAAAGTGRIVSCTSAARALRMRSNS